MAVYGELPRVLDVLRIQKETFYAALKDGVASQVYGSSPEQESPIADAASLDGFDVIRAPPVSADNRPIAEDPSKNKATNPSSKKPENQTPVDPRMFERDRSFKNTRPPRSLLTDQVARLKRRLIEAQVLVVGMSSPMKVTVEENATVEKVIVATLKALSVSNPQLANPSNPRAWTLRMYDPDDSPDEGMELTGNQPIKNFMTDKQAAFALCRNAATAGMFESESHSVVGGAAASARSHADTFVAGSFLQSSDRSAIKKQPIKILLPNNEHILQPYVPQMKIGKLLVKTCQRRQIDARKHQFVTAEGGQPLDPDATLEDLRTLELTMVPVAEQPAVVQQNQKIIWHDARAAQYQQFRVTKLKKNQFAPFGNKERRIMGIDRHLITNDSENRKKTKKPNHLIKDVKEVFLHGDAKPLQFTIVFVEGPTHKEQRYDYEARNQAEAKEIVQKIEYLKKMEQRGASMT